MFIIKAVCTVWCMYRMYLFLIQGVLAELKKKKSILIMVYLSSHELLNSQVTRRDDQE